MHKRYVNLKQICKVSLLDVRWFGTHLWMKHFSFIKAWIFSTKPLFEIMVSLRMLHCYVRGNNNETNICRKTNKKRSLKENEGFPLGVVRLNHINSGWRRLVTSWPLSTYTHLIISSSKSHPVSYRVHFMILWPE